MLSRPILRGAALLVAFASLPILAATARARTSGAIAWKYVDNAILRITGRKPPKQWNVYQDRKKKERVLVQIDSRYLILDAKTKQVFEISAAQFQARGKYFRSPNPSASQHALPSTDWDMRDIGPAERIEVRLSKENLTLDVELPHPLNLRVP
jgi:hypothetical protein